MPRVQVLVRCRPALPHEAGKPCSKVETNEVSNTVRVVASQTNARVFTFDRVLPETAQQEDVFENVLPMIDHALDGLHATIFAYGQTGSGKTHTMEGIDYVKDVGSGKLRPNPKTPPQQHGIIPRVIEALFERARLRMGANPHLQYRIAVSFMQIYNERVSDLLNPGVLKDGLKIRWTRSKFEVENLFHLECDSADQTRELFFMGVRNKMMSSHAMNQQSSRSHCLFTIHVSSYDPSDRDAVTKSELTLVDLAGSEKLAMLAENPSDKLVKESIEINASLLALGKVITALASKVKSHVPYRDAKLTKLLQHSLGGNSMTTMIACISPLDAYVDESMSTLMYAGRARNIHNDPVVNEDPRTALIRQLRHEIVTLKEQIAQLQTMAAAGLTDFQQLSQRPGKAAGAAAPERGGGGGSGGAGSDADAKQLADKLIASCEMLKHVIDTNTQLRGAFDALHTLKQEADQREYELQAENIALRERIELLESIVLADANTTTSGTEDGARPRSNNLLRSLDAAAAAPDPPMNTNAPADASRSRGAAATGPSRSDPSPVRPVQPSSRDQQQQQKLNAYSKKYRDPRGASSYSDYYGLAKKATEPSRNRQSQIVAEVESLITKAGPATAAMVPLSLQSTGNYGSLAFGGAREDVEELEERRRRRAEKRAALEEQHRRLQQGLSPAEMFSATATSATPAHSVAVPARPSSQHATRRAPTDQLFDYLSTSESASVFTSEQLQRLRERRGVGGSIPPPARKPGAAAGGAASDMAPTLRRDAQSNADYRRELMQAQNLVLSLNRGASH